MPIQVGPAGPADTARRVRLEPCRESVAPRSGGVVEEGGVEWKESLGSWRKVEEMEWVNGGVVEGSGGTENLRNGWKEWKEGMEGTSRFRVVENWNSMEGQVGSGRRGRLIRVDRAGGIPPWRAESEG